MCKVKLHYALAQVQKRFPLKVKRSHTQQDIKTTKITRWGVAKVAAAAQERGFIRGSLYSKLIRKYSGLR